MRNRPKGIGALLRDVGRLNWLPVEMANPHGLSRRLARAVTVSFGVRVVGMGLTFAIGVQLARYLGPEQYGVYAAVIAVAALLTVPAQFGLPQLITREVSVGLATGDHARVLGAMLWFTATIIAAACLMMAIGWFGIQLWPWPKIETLTAAYAWSLATIPMAALIALGLGALRGFHRVVSAQVYEALLRPALMALLLLLMFILSGQMTAATAIALQFAAGLATLFVIIWHLIRITPKAVRAAPPKRDEAVWLRSALPMTGTEVMRTIDGQYPVLLIGALATLGDLGIFRVALAVSALIGFLATAVNLVIMPHIAQLYAEQKIRQLELIAVASAAIVVAGSAAMTMGLYLFGRPLISWAFGDAFAPAWVPLLLIAISYIINGIFGSAAMILNMCGEETKLAQIYLVGPVVGIALTLALFPWLGVLAMAAGMIASEFAKGVWMTLVARRKLGIHSSLFSIGTVFARRSADPAQE